MTKEMVDRLLARAERYSALSVRCIEEAQNRPTDAFIDRAQKASDDAQAAFYLAKLAARDLKDGR